MSTTDHIASRVYHVELLTPKQNVDDLDKELKKFSTKYTRILDEGYMVCITDNPMGNLSFQGTEIIDYLELPVKPGQVSIHLNVFHTKQDLDNILQSCMRLGIDNLLIISGDGSTRLPRLQGEDVGYDVESVTSVELLKYIRREYPDTFELGVAFNPYEPQEHEMEKLQRKLEAGARFIITQPILDEHPAVNKLKELDVPVIVEAWMLKKIDLLSECVGYEIPAGSVHDPLDTLKKLIDKHPRCGFYLSFLGFKTQLPRIADLWT